MGRDQKTKFPRMSAQKLCPNPKLFTLAPISDYGIFYINQNPALRYPGSSLGGFPYSHYHGNEKILESLIYNI